jgi:AcrR family transcriptional regulator
MRKGEVTQKAILSQAMTLASAFGLEGLSIGALAERLKLSKSGLFAHFGSKEQLQIEILNSASEAFVEVVAKPTVKAPRGEARVRALMDHWLKWGKSNTRHGCIFVAASVELDDRPGPVREHLVAMQKLWLETRTRIVQTAVESGEFRRDLDIDQFVYDHYGIIFAFHYAWRLLNDPKAEEKARRSFEALVAAAKPRKN